MIKSTKPCHIAFPVSVFVKNHTKAATTAAIATTRAVIGFVAIAKLKATIAFFAASSAKTKPVNNVCTVLITFKAINPAASPANVALVNDNATSFSRKKDVKSLIHCEISLTTLLKLSNAVPKELTLL